VDNIHVIDSDPVGFSVTGFMVPNKKVSIGNIMAIENTESTLDKILKMVFRTTNTQYL